MYKDQQRADQTGPTDRTSRRPASARKGDSEGKIGKNGVWMGVGMFSFGGGEGKKEKRRKPEARRGRRNRPPTVTFPYIVDFQKILRHKLQREYPGSMHDSALHCTAPRLLHGAPKHPRSRSLAGNSTEYPSTSPSVCRPLDVAVTGGGGLACLLWRIDQLIVIILAVNNNTHCSVSHRQLRLQLH